MKQSIRIWLGLFSLIKSPIYLAFIAVLILAAQLYVNDAEDDVLDQLVLEQMQ